MCTGTLGFAKRITKEKSPVSAQCSCHSPPELQRMLAELSDALRENPSGEGGVKSPVGRGSEQPGMAEGVGMGQSLRSLPN